MVACEFVSVDADRLRGPNAAAFLHAFPMTRTGRVRRVELVRLMYGACRISSI